MAIRIYIGNMSFVTTEETLTSTFSRYGKVLSSEVIRDKFTEQSKGFPVLYTLTDITISHTLGSLFIPDGIGT